MRKKYIVIVTIFVFLLLLGISEFFTALLVKDKMSFTRNSVTEKANLVRIGLESAINTTMNLAYGLVAYVSVYPDFEKNEMDRLARFVIEETDLILNIALARDNIITYVNPYEKNREVLGLDYHANPQQSSSVIELMKTKKKILAGPVNLVQGGVGFIGRIPIYRDRDKEDYWGLASIVLDTEKIYEAGGVPERGTGGEFAMRGKEGQGGDGEIFLGRGSLFEDKPGTLPVTLFEGQWILAAIPDGGWDNAAASGKILIIRVLGVFIALLVASSLLLLLVSNRKMHYYALYDHLTGLANMRLFRIVSEQILSQSSRKNRMFALMFFDLDDFKNINDVYGHKNGDRVLSEVARRISEVIRKTDLVCRYGGDEYLIILPDINETDNVSLIAEKIVETVKKPIVLSGKEVEIKTSMGIAVYPDDGLTISDLMKKADHAMYSVKKGGKSNFRFYSSVSEKNS